MLELLLIALVWIIAICVVAAIALWAVRQFGPASFQEPARLIIGAVALIAILILLVRVVQRVGPALP